MKRKILYACFIVANFAFFNNISFAKLTSQQINLLLEYDDIQIYSVSPALVKKSSMSVEQSTDFRRSRTIVEYDEKGLLLNYYAASVLGSSAESKKTVITTLMRSGKRNWQRKQTVGSYDIDNSVYVLKNNTLEIKRLPSYDSLQERLLFQQNQILDDGQLLVKFDYKQPIEKQKFDIEYYFDQKGSLNFYHLSHIDGSEYGYTSMARNRFEYDNQLRLIKSDKFTYYQFMTEPTERISTEVTYSNFDKYGNWLRKVEYTEGNEIVYKRVIEYW